jgi:hypothetical protein
MHFKDFITRQRVGIVVAGFAIFVIALLAAKATHYEHMTGALFTDLAASAITVIFTALVIDYLSVREEHDKTRNAAGLAEDEIAATCFRMQWRMARLFGLEPRQTGGREHISNRDEARDYLEEVRQEVDSYLDSIDLTDTATPLNADSLPKYLERLQAARTELEQTLLLYEYAMSYSLRERVLGLRSELQVAENILGFIDFTEKLNEANESLVRITSKAIHDAIADVLGHGSKAEAGLPIHAKDSPLT